MIAIFRHILAQVVPHIMITSQEFSLENDLH